MQPLQEANCGAPQDQRSRSNYLELSIEHVMRVMPISRCYLCGTPLEKTGVSQDHVVPKTLRVRKQSKVRGFRYAGTLPTHRKCNNEFGPETYVGKALDLIAALNNDGVQAPYRSLYSNDGSERRLSAFVHEERSSLF